MGYIVTADQLFHVLRIAGVDTDEKGNFCVDGTIVSFMGMGEEFTIGDDAVGYIDGRPSNICNMLDATSYGMKVKVI